MKTNFFIVVFLAIINFNGLAQNTVAVPVSNADSLLIGTWYHFIADINAPEQDSINTGMLVLNDDFNFSFTSKLMPGITYTGFFNASGDSLVFLYSESSTVGSVYFRYELSTTNKKLHLKSLNIRRSTLSKHLSGKWMKEIQE